MNRSNNLLLSGIFFLMCCLSGQNIVAQGKYAVSGEVIDSVTNKGVEYATVAITDAQSKVIAMLVCDVSGKFNSVLKSPGDYRVVFSSLGYTNKEMPLSVQNPKTDIGKIYLLPGVQVEAVSVETTKPLIRSDIDKIAYSVEADPEAQSSTALDILRKVPLVTVDGEDNVLLQGQSNYKVLINGKSSSLMSKNFKDVIRSMPASSIKDIEVITNPSSKYEAEGVGGIINIITTRKNTAGYSGSVGTVVDTRGGVGGNAYVSAKAGKFSLSAGLYAMRFVQPLSESSGYRENKISDEYKYTYTHSRNSQDVTGTGYNYQFEASYEIDTFNLITMSLWGMTGDFNVDMSTLSEIKNNKMDMVQSYINTFKTSNSFGGISGNIDYQRTFKKPDETFTLSYKLENNPQKGITENVIEEILNYPSYGQYSRNDAASFEHTFQVDYTNPFTKKHNMEVGAKYILRQNNSTPDVYRRTNPDDPWLPDPARRNDLDYDQHILGVYAGYTLKLKKLSFKAGLRGEGTWNDGVFTQADPGNVTATVDSHFDNRMFNLIPYATISFAPKTSGRLSLSYTQRLSRPGINYLNPYVNDIDPLNISTGNPHLKSEVSHTFNLTYGLFSPKHSLNLTANSAFTNNAIEQVVSIDDSGVSTTTYANIGKKDNYGLNIYYSFRQGAKFSVSANLSGNYTRLEMRGANPIDNSGFTYSGFLNGRVGLWKNAAFSVNGFYSSPRISLQGKNASFFHYGVNLSQKAFKEKVTFGVDILNPFNNNFNFWSEYDTDTFYQRSETIQKMRQARFSVRFNFGKMDIQVKKARRGIQNDDLKAGDGNSAGSVGGAGASAGAGAK